MIKRLFIVAAFSLLMASFSIGAIFSAEACPPGCDCGTPGAPGDTGGIMGAMERHAEAVRVEDKAIAQQVIKQNDNALGMTCFDRAVGLTSRLGQVFSDKLPKDDPNSSDDDVPVLNTSVFSAPVYDDGFGANNALLKELKEVIEPTMNKHIKNFGPPDQPYSPPLSAAIGANAFSSLLTNLVSGLIDPLFGPNSPISGMLEQLNGVNGYVNQYIGYYNTLQQAMQLVGLGMPGNIAQYVTAFNLAWNAIQSAITTPATQVISGIISDAFNQMTSNILGDETSMNNPVNGAKRNCSRIARLWSPDPIDSALPGTLYKSLTGSGPEKGIPYLSIKQLLTASATELGGLGGESDFLQGIANSAGPGGILDKALQDINVGGILQGPTNAPGSPWQNAPYFPVGTATTSDIINAM